MVDAGTTHYVCLQCAIYALLSMVVAQGTNVALLMGEDCISKLDEGDLPHCIILCVYNNVM